jgi:delta 1-pyrroline-5-carboxylate dehydrogenase
MSSSSISNPVCIPVPSGVLSVLPGPGITTGKELVSHPLIRKVDITVALTVSTIWHDSERILRQALIQGAH